MRIFYDYEGNKILTEEEARKSVKKDVLNDNFALWEFIENNYSSEEILGSLKQEFLEKVIDKSVESWLNDNDYFLVREFPD